MEPSVLEFGYTYLHRDFPTPNLSRIDVGLAFRSGSWALALRLCDCGPEPSPGTYHHGQARDQARPPLSRQRPDRSALVGRLRPVWSASAPQREMRSRDAGDRQRYGPPVSSPEQIAVLRWPGSMARLGAGRRLGRETGNGAVARSLCRWRGRCLHLPIARAGSLAEPDLRIG